MECTRTKKHNTRHGRLHVLQDDVLQDAPVDFERGGTVQGSICLGLAFAVRMLNIPVPFEGRGGHLEGILIINQHTDLQHELTVESVAEYQTWRIAKRTSTHVAPILIAPSSATASAACIACP